MKILGFWLVTLALLGWSPFSARAEGVAHEPLPSNLRNAYSQVNQIPACPPGFKKIYSYLGGGGPDNHIVQSYQEICVETTDRGPGRNIDGYFACRNLEKTYPQFAFQMCAMDWLASYSAYVSKLDGSHLYWDDWGSNWGAEGYDSCVPARDQTASGPNDSTAAQFLTSCHFRNPSGQNLTTALYRCCGL